MDDRNKVSPYSDPAKPNSGGAWPAAGQAQYAQPPYMQQGGQVQYVQQPYMPQGGQVHIIPQSYIDPSIYQIRDWLPWSIVNIFIGWLFAGILPLIFSLLCRSHKRSNNASGARTMGTLALVFNILVTIGGLGGWIALIVIIATAARTITYINCLNWPYC